jgi:hypothetical protein
MFSLGSVFYTGFFSLQVFLNLFIDNAFLCIIAVGMTFVIISGGIDLSVGSVIALTTMVSAALLEKYHWNPAPVLLLVLAIGAGLGCVMGCLIHFFKLQPFIVTLAGMFLARGLCYLVSIDSISISNPLYTSISQYRLPVYGDSSISVGAVIALVVLGVAVFIAHFTKFGRTVYAIGGNEQAGERENPPRRFRRFIAVGPVRSQPVVAPCVDQFETAATTIRPASPLTAGPVLNLVYNHIGDVGDELTQLICSNHKLRPRQGKSLALVAQGAAEAARSIVGVQGRVPSQEIRLIPRHHQVSVPRDQGVGRERKVDARGESPPAQVGGARAAIINLHVFIVVVPGNRMVHDFVDHDIAEEQ